LDAAQKFIIFKLQIVFAAKIPRSCGGGKMAQIVEAFVEFFTLTEEQRKVVGEKVLELGNIGASALVFGTALAEGRIKWQYMLAGALFWLLMFCGYLLITRSRGRKND
jgi:hypothetical protein